MAITNDHRASDSASSWAIRISVAVAFVLTGLDKFPANAASYWVHAFDAIGLGQWFRYFTGAVELLGGLLFLVPAATLVGAVMLIATMAGAMAVHVFVFRHPADSIFPGVYLAGVVVAFAKLRATKSYKLKTGSS